MSIAGTLIFTSICYTHSVNDNTCTLILLELPSCFKAIPIHTCMDYATVIPWWCHVLRFTPTLFVHFFKRLQDLNVSVNVNVQFPFPLVPIQPALTHAEKIQPDDNSAMKPIPVSNDSNTSVEKNRIPHSTSVVEDRIPDSVIVRPINQSHVSNLRMYGSFCAHTDHHSEGM